MSYAHIDASKALRQIIWSLAIGRREDYASAGIPVLPVTHGVRVTKLQILLYTVPLVAVTMLPFVTHMSGLVYLVGVIALGIGFLYSMSRPSADIASRAIHDLATLCRFPVYRLGARGTANATHHRRNPLTLQPGFLPNDCYG